MSRKFKLNVKCDAPLCGWRQEDVNIYDWHKVLCLKCQKKIIITDEELELFEIVHGLMKTAGLAGGPLSEPYEEGPVTIVIDSASLLNQKEQDE